MSAWSDCKVAFGVLSGEAILEKFAKPLWLERLPAGWTPVEMDPRGARCVMVFRVERRLPTDRDARAVRRLLTRMEPRT